VKILYLADKSTTYYFGGQRLHMVLHITCKNIRS